MPATHLDFEGAYNIRDLGGLPTRDGGVTRPRVFVRADCLHQLTPAAQQQMIDYGIRTIIDLRTSEELQMSPDVFAGSQMVNYLHLPFVGDELASGAAWQEAYQKQAPMHERYVAHLPLCQPALRTIFTALAEETPTVLFHCFAGKDRTGMIAALLLGALGVPDEVIAEDYAHTYVRLTPLIAKWRVTAEAEGQDMEQFEIDVRADAETIQFMLDYVRAEYGSAEGYLRLCGVTGDQLDRIREKFVQPANQ